MSLQSYNASGNIFPDKNGGEPFLEILENPKSRGFRFRYTCEGPSHGGIPGASSDKNKKTFPAVRICNYQGYARIVVQLVTNEENPRLHPHSLVGKQCQNGICTVQCGPKDMTATFPNLGIQHVTKKNVANILEERYIAAEMQLSSINDGFPQEVQKNIKEEDRKRIALKAQSEAKSIDLAVVRLMFIAYLPDSNGAFTIMLKPVISEAIFDSKAPNAATLKICRMDCNAGSASGGDEVYLLCDKVQKDDIQVRFFEEDATGAEIWEGYGNFCPTDVHRQFAIVFRTPAYKDQSLLQPVNVQVQLKRKSDGEVSESRSFMFLPNKTDLEMIERKRRKLMPDFLDHIGGNGQGKGFQFGSGLPLSQMNFNFQNNTSNGGTGNEKVKEARKPARKVPDPQRGPIDPTSLMFNIKQEPASPVNNSMFGHASPQAFSPASLMSEGDSPRSRTSLDEVEEFIPGTRVPLPKHSKQQTKRIPSMSFNSVPISQTTSPSNFFQQTQTYHNGVMLASPQQDSSQVSYMSPSQNYHMSPSQNYHMSPSQSSSSSVSLHDPTDDFSNIPSLDQNQNLVTLNTINDADILGQAFQQTYNPESTGGYDLIDPLMNQPLQLDLQEIQMQGFDLDNLVESDAGMEKGQPPAKENKGPGNFESGFEYDDGNLEDDDDSASTSVNIPSQSYAQVESDAAASISRRIGNLRLEPNIKQKSPVTQGVPPKSSPITQGVSPTSNPTQGVPPTSSPITQGVPQTSIPTQGVPPTSNPTQKSATNQQPKVVEKKVDEVYKKLSRALQDYSVSGDVRMLLVMQRKLSSVSDENGDSVLHLAVIHDQLEVLTSFLDVIATLEDYEKIINKRNKLHQTPLLLAAMSDNLEAVIDLLKFGANPLLADANGNNVLHIASRHGNADILSRALRTRIVRESDGLDARNHSGNGCFHLATKAKMNARKTMYLLRDHHFDVNMYETKSGRTALHLAVEENNLVLVGCLITECDADIDAATYDGYSPLHLASSLGFRDIVMLLLACGANPEISTQPPDQMGEKPVDLASKDEIKDLLLGNVEFARDSIDYETQAINEDDLDGLDPMIRMKLCKILNDENQSGWEDLARGLDMERIISSIRKTKDPTNFIIDKYSCEHGTVVGLRSALMKLGRDDAVQLLNRAVITGPCCYDNEFSERNDSGIDSHNDVINLEFA